MRRLGLSLALAVSLAGCATSAAFRSGENAERLQDYDRAVLEYQRAVQAAPDNVNYHRALDRARMRASTDHTNRARRLVASGQYDEALTEYRLALELSPGASGISEEMKDAAAYRERGRASLDELKARARERALPGLELTADAQQRSAWCSAGRASGRPTSRSRALRRSTSPSTRRSRTRS